MLPTTYQLNDDGGENNVANLNAAFVTDNSLGAATEEVAAGELEHEVVTNGNGNNEAETNKPLVMDDDKIGNYDGTDDEAAFVEQEPQENAVNSSLSKDAGLTIENNEEAEEIDNFNESAATTTASELTKELSELELSADSEAEAEDSTADDDLRAELVEEVADDVHDADDKDDNHSNYAAAENHREDASSSDDDEGEGDAIEMNAAFNSEWSDLAEDLAKVNDNNNDLNNDIDVYDTVPIDLSNDIAVNDVAAADANFPINPDAEFVEVEGAEIATNERSSMPMFGKLTAMHNQSQPSSYQPTTYSHDMK